MRADRSPTGALSVLIAGGGSAGHVEPALAVADVLRARGHIVTLAGTAQGIEARLVPARGYPLELVPRVPWPRRLGPDLVRLPARLRRAVAAASEVLRRTRADVVLGVGGYVCVPVYLAARRRHVPIVVHEANSVPGLANRLGARLTSHVAVSVPATPLRHGVVTGLPLRTGITDLDRDSARAGARARLGLPPEATVMLVTGGSQGARRINEAVSGAATELLAAGIAVLHITGEDHLETVRGALDRAGVGQNGGYVCLPYAHDMAACYAAADVALCRAGAVTCAELSAVGLPAVYVPLPIGNGEQERNARPAVAAGAGWIVADAECTSSFVTGALLPLLQDPVRFSEMTAAARRARPGPGEVAAVVVADMVERAARQTGDL